MCIQIFTSIRIFMWEYVGIFGKFSTYLLHQYTNLSIAPKKRHNSDWHYPVDFWTEKDGSEAKQNTIIEKAIG